LNLELKTASMVQVNKTEINFLRLLQICERMAAPESLEHPKTPVDKKKYSKYLEVLQGYIAELKPLKKDPEINSYSKRVDILLELNIPPQLRKPTRKEMEQELFGTKSIETPSTPTSVPKSKIESKSQKEQLFESEGLTKRRGFALKSDKEDFVDETLWKQVMENNKKQQDAYTDEMVLLTTALKHNTQAMAGILKKDDTTLGRLEEITQKNVDAVKAEKGRVTTHNSQSFSWTLTIWVLIAIVGLMFIGTYFFIKIW